MGGGQKMQEREERRERKNTDEKKEGHIEEISLHKKNQDAIFRSGNGS